jgi:hypothetical protein
MNNEMAQNQPISLEGRVGGPIAAFAEVWGFILTTKKWWLIPVLMALLLLGLMVVVSGSVYAPFLYTLF